MAAAAIAVQRFYEVKKAVADRSPELQELLSKVPKGKGARGGAAGIYPMLLVIGACAADGI